MSNEKEFFNKLADLLERYDVDIYAPRGEVMIDSVYFYFELHKKINAETCRKIAVE